MCNGQKKISHGEKKKTFLRKLLIGSPKVIGWKVDKNCGGCFLCGYDWRIRR